MKQPRMARCLALLLLVSCSSAPVIPSRIGAPALSDEARRACLQMVRAVLENQDQGSSLGQIDAPDGGARLVAVSLGRQARTALVGIGAADTLSEALREAASKVRNVAAAGDLSKGRIKIDIAIQSGPDRKFDAKGRAEIDRSLQGLWLPDVDLVLLPEEVLSRKLINSKGDLQSKALSSYLQESRGRKLGQNPGKAGDRYRTLLFDSFVEGPDRDAVKLYRGNPAMPSVDSRRLRDACREGGDYLLRHQHHDGLFDYAYEPATDEQNEEYNELRHAGAAYALLELYADTRDVRYLRAGERAIEALWQWIQTPPGTDHESIVYSGGEAKLGGAALAIIAVLKHREVTGSDAWLPRARKLAGFLLHQQQKDGRFESKYFFGEADDTPFESVYYPGEAILALTRLHVADPSNPSWKRAARLGADWIVGVRDAQKGISELPHDHWLLIALNELYPLTRATQHLDHAERIAESIVQSQRTSSARPDWIGTFYDPPRSTPAATRAEGLLAIWSLAGRENRERGRYLPALKSMAAFQLRCQVTAENSLYLPRPDLARGGFRRSLEDWEIRIDYVQHNISSLLGLSKIAD